MWGVVKVPATWCHVIKFGDWVLSLMTFSGGVTSVAVGASCFRCQRLLLSAQ